MRDRATTMASVAAVAGVLGLCCGLPVLLSLGVLGAVAGLSIQNWILIGIGLVLAAVGWSPAGKTPTECRSQLRCRRAARTSGTEYR